MIQLLIVMNNNQNLSLFSRAFISKKGNAITCSICTHVQLTSGIIIAYFLVSGIYACVKDTCMSSPKFSVEVIKPDFAIT